MNKVELQGTLARDCHVSDCKNGQKMYFLTVRATRDGGSDFVPVKAFDLPEALVKALVKDASVYVAGHFQAGKYDKEKKEQLYENIVVAGKIQNAVCTWSAAAFTVPGGGFAASAN